MQIFLFFFIRQHFFTCNLSEEIDVSMDISAYDILQIHVYVLLSSFSVINADPSI